MRIHQSSYNVATAVLLSAAGIAVFILHAIFFFGKKDWWLRIPGKRLFANV